MTDNITYTARFDYDQYSITLSVDSSNHGTVVGAGTFNYLSNRTISATPSYGYHFVQWSDGNTDNPRYFTLVQDTSFTALFEKNIYSVIAMSADTGRGTVTGSDSVVYLDSVTLTATARYGYHFAAWSDGNTENPRTVQATGDITLKALFEVNNYTVTANNAWGGGTYPYGSTATLMALPQVGLQFDGWSDGQTANPRAVAVGGDTTLTALYRAPDTVRIYDTTTVYDTVINIVYDTTQYHHYVYDTTRVYDTLVYVDTLNRYYYDTIRVYDTLVYVDTLNHYYYDTTRVYDTLVYVDTLNRYYYDTTRVYDTLVYVDTLNHYYFDTTVSTHYIFDSIWVFDTLYIVDTVHVHDTIYVTDEGIDNATPLNAKIYSQDGHVVVEGADGNAVALYDVSGRLLATRSDEGMPLRFDVPASGAYLVRIGQYAARRVVVIR